MKNIQFFLICIFQLAILQLAIGQETVTDKNGRSLGTTAQEVVPEETPSVNNTNETFTGSDFDVPGNYPQQDNEHTFYPQQVDILHDELLNSASPQEMVAQIEALRSLVADLHQSYEEMRKENRLIRRSLGACCSRDELGLSANDAYLLQNAPNPVRGRANISFFIPEGLKGSQIEIRDIKGVLIETFEVDAKGMGELVLESNGYSSGTYLYYLSIDGEVVDSKVMIITH